MRILLQTVLLATAIMASAAFAQDGDQLPEKDLDENAKLAAPLAKATAGMQPGVQVAPPAGSEAAGTEERFKGMPDDKVAAEMVNTYQAHSSEDDRQALQEQANDNLSDMSGPQRTVFMQELKQHYPMLQAFYVPGKSGDTRPTAKDESGEEQVEATPPAGTPDTSANGGSPDQQKPPGVPAPPAGEQQPPESLGGANQQAVPGTIVR